MFKAGHCETGSTKLVTSVPKKRVPMRRSDVTTESCRLEADKK